MILHIKYHFKIEDNTEVKPDCDDQYINMIYGFLS